MILIGKGPVAEGRYGIRLIPKNIVLCRYSKAKRKDGEEYLKWIDVGMFGSLEALINSSIFYKVTDSHITQLHELVEKSEAFMKSIDIDKIVSEFKNELQESYDQKKQKYNERIAELTEQNKELLKRNQEMSDIIENVRKRSLL